MSEEVRAADAALTALYEAQQEITRLMAENDRLVSALDKAETDLYRERDLNVRIRRWARRFVLAVDRGNIGTIAVMRDCLVRRLDTDDQTTDDAHEEAALLAELEAARTLESATRNWRTSHVISKQMIAAMDAMDAARKSED